VKVVNDPYREEKDVIAAVSGRVPPAGGRGRGAGPGTA
jgi:hypothetical protein